MALGIIHLNWCNNKKMIKWKKMSNSELIKKINLADIIAFDNYSDENMSDIEYVTITSMLVDMDISSAFVSILLTIKEKKELISTLIVKEFGFLRQMIVDDGEMNVINLFDSCYILKNIKTLLDTPSMDNIIVFNSSTYSIPEQKAVLFFSEEVLLLKELLKSEMKELMCEYSDISKDDSTYERIKEVSRLLSSVVLQLNKSSKDSSIKVANAFLNSKTLEEQMLFFGKLIKANQIYTEPVAIAHNRESDENIVDVDLTNVEEESSHSSDNGVTALIEGLNKVLDRGFIDDKEREFFIGLKNEIVIANSDKNESIHECLHSIENLLGDVDERLKNNMPVSLNDEMLNDEVEELDNMQELLHQLTQKVDTLLRNVPDEDEVFGVERQLNKILSMLDKIEKKETPIINDESSSVAISKVEQLLEVVVRKIDAKGSELSDGFVTMEQFEAIDNKVNNIASMMESFSTEFGSYISNQRSITASLSKRYNLK